MPYIPKKDRYVKENKEMILNKGSSIGKWNFVFTTLILAYLKYHGESYKTYNEIIGMIECVKQEFYRRAVAKYEDKKKKENGDVYV